MKRFGFVVATALTILGFVVPAKAVEGRVCLGGPFNYYGMMGFSEKWELTTEDGNLYQGTFNIPADKLIFCFYDSVDEDHFAIYGAPGRDGSRTSFSFEEQNGIFSSVLQVSGMGDWAVEDWPGGEVSFAIDFGQVPETVYVSTTVNPYPSDDNGVESIAGMEDDAPVYNLQGVRIDGTPTQPGLYIIKGKKVFKTN